MRERESEGEAVGGKRRSRNTILIKVKELGRISQRE